MTLMVALPDGTYFIAGGAHGESDLPTNGAIGFLFIRQRVLPGLGSPPILTSALSFTTPLSHVTNGSLSSAPPQLVSRFSELVTFALRLGIQRGFTTVKQFCLRTDGS